VDCMFYASAARKSAENLRCSNLPSSAHSVDDQAADTNVGAVAEADTGSGRVLESLSS
jgi:hypothetical protein